MMAARRRVAWARLAVDLAEEHEYEGADRLEQIAGG
jgi:hypothetical protein